MKYAVIMLVLCQIKVCNKVVSLNDLKCITYAQINITHL